MDGSCPIDKVLGDANLLQEIFLRLGSVGNLLSAAAVNPTWYAAAKLPGFLTAFRERCVLPVIGHVVEFEKQNMWSSSIFVPLAGIGGELAQISQRVMQAFSDPDRTYTVLGSCDSRLLVKDEVPAPSFHELAPADEQMGIREIHPMAQPMEVPTPNTFGYFAVVGGEFAVFIRRPVGQAERCHKGVYFNTNAPMQYYVNIERDGAWSRDASEPVHRGRQVYFLENPYAIIKRGMVFIMYEVGKVMSYDVTNGSFSLLVLPADFRDNADKGGSDYKVSRCTPGTICIVQTQGVDLHIWDRDQYGAWVARATISIPITLGVPLTTSLWVRVLYAGTNSYPACTSFYCIKVLSADECARHVSVSFGFMTRAYTINTETLQSSDLFDRSPHQVLTQVLPVTVRWPPKFDQAFAHLG
ncbi:hypothetical protein VPH35_066782 [Triticum aestivum]|nr:uncharacterized protein LOC123082199 [Triticum aestivum]XP_044360535.1 uncharacterized protein LOC123082225 [Triticum aestivum]